MLCKRSILRLYQILSAYESSKGNKKVELSEQIAFDLSGSNDNKELTDYINSIDPLNTTPLEALNIIFKIKEISKK